MTDARDLSLTDSSDEQLIAAFNEGDAEAFAEILRRYRRPIFNFILRSVRNIEKAEDLQQEVFLRVVQRSDQFEGKSKFSTWLYTIARNLCIDMSRKMVHRRHASLDAPVRADEGSAPLVDRIASTELETDRRATSNHLQSEIAHAVEALPDLQREVFVLRHVQGMSFKEIARVVDASENTVKSRMRYALTRLQQALAEYREYAHQLK